MSKFGTMLAVAILLSVAVWRGVQSSADRASSSNRSHAPVAVNNAFDETGEAAPRPLQKALPAPLGRGPSHEKEVTSKSLAEADRDALAALAKSRCEAAARRLIDAIQRAEADVDRHGNEWRHIQERLREWSVYAPGSGMSIPNPQEVDFPRHGKDIRGAAYSFELDFLRATIDVKQAWIQFHQDSDGVVDADPPTPDELSSIVQRALFSKTVAQAARIYTNLDAQLQAIKQRYQQSLKTR